MITTTRLGVYTLLWGAFFAVTLGCSLYGILKSIQIDSTNIEYTCTVRQCNSFVAECPLYGAYYVCTVNNFFTSPVLLPNLSLNFTTTSTSGETDCTKVYPRGFSCYVNTDSSVVSRYPPITSVVSMAFGVLSAIAFVLGLVPGVFLFIDWKRVIVDGQRPKGFRTYSEAESAPLIA